MADEEYTINVRTVTDDRTVDGVLITLGLRVVDYNRDHGEVIKLGTVTEINGQPDPNGAWHTVRTDKGTENIFDRTRLHSEKNYRPGY